ncbi:MAG: hypothetical protein IT342_04780 [Candidatus Melainabacteria bacterium]|nr:hypothetical protein [Candidatus Melainabacteria bacterium]
MPGNQSAELNNTEKSQLEKERNELEASIMGMMVEKMELPAHVAERFKYLCALLDEGQE